MNKRITFITHGSKQLGMGHVMRCCSLAETFRQKGWEVFFFSKFYLGGNYIRQKGFLVDIWEKEESEEACEEFYFGEEKELEADLDWMSSLLSEQKPEVIFLDSYNVNSNFLKALKSFTKCLVYLDDLAVWDYPVDIILNPNVDAEKKRYKYFNNQKKHLVGSKYNLLRGEFSDIAKRKAKEEVENIFITTGAADPKNMMKLFLELCRSLCPQATCHLIIGNAFQKQKEWEKEATKKVKIYRSPTRMSEIMMQCDIAVSAGGSTIYELAACGVPTLAFLYSENQRGVVEYLSREGYLTNIGEYQKFIKKDKDTLNSFSAKWTGMMNWKKRQIMIDRQQNLFDGEGRNRVVKEIEDFL